MIWPCLPSSNISLLLIVLQPHGLILLLLITPSIFSSQYLCTCSSLHETYFLFLLPWLDLSHLSGLSLRMTSAEDFILIQSKGRTYSPSHHITLLSFPREEITLKN